MFKKCVQFHKGYELQNNSGKMISEQNCLLRNLGKFKNVNVIACQRFFVFGVTNYETSCCEERETMVICTTSPRREEWNGRS